MTQIRSAGFHFSRLLLAIFLVLFFATVAHSQSTENLALDSESGPQRINELSELIAQKTQQRNELRSQIIASGDNAEDSDRERLVALSEDLDGLNDAFLFALLGDQVDIYALEDVEDPETTWQEDVVEVLKPLADTLKAVTRRPREVASLKETIDIANQKSMAIQSAIELAGRLEDQSLTQTSATALQSYLSTWSQELNQVRQDKLLAESQLNSILNSNGSGWTDFWTSVKEFMLGRGLTLVIAIIAAVIAWLIMRTLWWFYSTKIATKETRRKSLFYRFSAYSYYIVTGFVVVLAVLLTLWLREDLLLLAIAFVALASLALGFRQYLPSYMTEARLLLNLGNVREDERVVYDGLPWQVMSLNIQTVLRNPAIDGVLRLPLSTIATLSSRPIKNNLWFPTNIDDYVLLPDGLFGRIKCQTPDLVEIAVRGGMTLTYPTSEFFSVKVLNLTKDETFGVSTTFGLDYSLQSICLTTVPATLREAIHNALIREGYAEHVVGELVELSSANESSLDYIVFITMGSEVASSYYAIERLLVQTCIEVANEHNWGIPFPQLTVHTASPVPA